MAIKKIRLDLLLGERLPSYSRQQIQSWIMQGKICVDGVIQTKAGTLLAPDVAIVCNIDEPRYVSRAGFKLEKALDAFGITVVNKVCLDAGISTGGFTDCLLQRDAQKIFGVDVGRGQVNEKIWRNNRVVLKEGVNVRYLTPEMLGELVDLVTLDLSFISVLKVIDAVTRCVKPQAELVILIKPQFEARRADVGRGGIVRNPVVHQEVIKTIVQGVQKYNFQSIGVIESPITGSMGNKEFLAYFVKIEN